jgi:hypothetical protein
MVDWPFNFWDVEAKCRMKGKLEGMITVDPEVYVIPCLSEDGAPRKSQRIGDVSIVFYLLDPIVGSDIEVLEFANLPSDGEPPPERHDSSRGSATASEEQPLKSTLISKEVMQWYVKGEERLKHELKQLCLEDHLWFLKSWDHNGVGVVKVHCVEYVKDLRCSTGYHNKVAVSNLFNNFRKSHVMSTAHIQSWCCRKGVDFCDHPQSVAGKGKSIVLVMYESNCRTFGYSRVVGMPITARMMLMPMVRLTCEELLQLRTRLEHVLSIDFHMEEGVDWRPLAAATPNLWLTPAFRSY